MATEQFIESIQANLTYWMQQVELHSGDSQARVLDIEWPNLYWAVQNGLAEPQTQNETIELMLAAFHFVERRGYWREWIAVLERAIATCSTQQMRARCKLLDRIGYLQRQDWQLGAALASHHEQERIALEVGDSLQLGLARFNLSEDYRYNHQYAEAEAAGFSALELLEAAQADKQKVAAALNVLGLVAQAQGKHDVARDLLSRAITLLRDIDQPTQLARALNNVGNTLAGLGETDAAIATFEEANALLQNTASEFDKVMVAMSLGTLQFDLGDFDAAEATFLQANSRFLQRSGHIYFRALAANNLGNVFLKQGRVEEALSFLHTSAGLFRQTSARVMLGNTLGTLGEALSKKQLSEKASEAYDEALTLLAQHPDDAWANKLHAEYAEQRRRLSEKPNPAMAQRQERRGKRKN